MIVFHCRNHVEYNRTPWLDLTDEEYARREKKLKHASKDAEMVAVLLAMAQKQALRLNKKQYNGCCSDAICVSKQHYRSLPVFPLIALVFFSLFWCGRLIQKSVLFGHTSPAPILMPWQIPQNPYLKH